MAFGRLRLADGDHSVCRAQRVPRGAPSRRGGSARATTNSTNARGAALDRKASARARVTSPVFDTTSKPRERYLSPHERTMPKTEYLQGALDLLILQILALGPNHGWAIQQRIHQVSREALNVSQGSLYPALHRLEAAGFLASEMTASENNRRARMYTLTAAGRRRLSVETDDWREFSLAIRRVIQAG